MNSKNTTSSTLHIDETVVFAEVISEAELARIAAKNQELEQKMNQMVPGWFQTEL